MNAFLFIGQTVAAAVVAAGRGAVHAAPTAADVVAIDLNVGVGSHSSRRDLCLRKRRRLGLRLLAC